MARQAGDCGCDGGREEPAGGKPSSFRSPNSRGGTGREAAAEAPPRGDVLDWLGAPSISGNQTGALATSRRLALPQSNADQHFLPRPAGSSPPLPGTEVWFGTGSVGSVGGPSGYCGEYGVFVGTGPNESSYLACECKVVRDPGESPQWKPDYVAYDAIYAPHAASAGDLGRMLINEEEIVLTDGGTDPANAVHPSVWVTTPPDLANYWSTSFPFDNALCQWVYVNVGRQQDPECKPWCQGGEWLGFVGEGAYLVSGLIPYAAYKIVAESSSSYVRQYRVRVWVGLMHHFSFFVPPSDYTDHSSRWGVDVIETYANDEGSPWDPVNERVSARGWFAGMFLSLTDGLRTEVTYQSHLGETRWVPVVYGCDAEGNVNRYYPYEVAYAAGTSGEPTGLCFSDPWAFEETEDETCAYLGASIWGEVCVTSSPDEPRPFSRAIAQQAFALLFPAGEVTVAWKLAFMAKDFSGNAQDSEVTRWFTLNARDVVQVDSLIEKVNTLRSTPEGRYVVRNWDVNRLEDAAAAASVGESCCT